LVFNGQVPFELLSISAQQDGFELEFTKPLPENLADIDKMIRVRQWRYEATPAYGGPKLDESDLSIRASACSADGRKLSLQIPGLKTGYVIYFLLDADLLSRNGDPLWSGEAWYTLNRVPAS